MSQQDTLPPIPTPIAYYTFDEGSGSTVSDSIGSSDGTITSGSWSGSGKINSSFLGSGTGSNIDVSSFSTPSTISISVRLDITYDMSGDQNIATSRSGSTRSFIFQVEDGNSGRIRFQVGGYASVRKFPGGFSGRHHFVGTFDPSANNCKTYVDGVLKNTQYNSSSTADLGFMTMGGVDGKLDELGIWDVALTPEEVSYLYNSGAGQRPF